MPKVIRSDLIQEDTINLLSKFQILKELSKDEIETLLGKDEAGGYQLRISKLVQYAKDETVMEEGEFDSWVFWVVKGEFAALKNGVIVSVFSRPGEVFGEMSIMEGDSRSASVITLTSGICLGIDMSILDNLKDEILKSKINSGIQRLKSERLNMTTCKLAEEKRRVAIQLDKIDQKTTHLNKKERQLKQKEEDLKAREKNLEELEQKLFEKDA